MFVPLKLKIAAFGAAWFALVAGVGLPLVMAILPFSHSSLVQMGQEVIVGLRIFGPSAAIVGFLLANRAVSSGVWGSFLIGATLVAFTCILSGVLLSLVASHAHTLRGTVSDGLTVGLGFLMIDIVFFVGAPFIGGGFSALVFRKLARSKGMLKNER